MRMKSIKSVPQFDFIREERWKRLTKKEFSDLMSYKGTYSHLLKSQQRVEELKKKYEGEIQKEMDKQNNYYTNLMKVSKKIDYLRDKYHISCSIHIGKKYKKKDGSVSQYYSISINRRNRTTLSCNLGTDTHIKSTLKEFYKNDKRVLNQIKEMGWLEWLKNECNDKNTLGGIKWNCEDIIDENKDKVDGTYFSLEKILPQ
jgi:hypothetical protein